MKFWKILITVLSLMTIGLAQAAGPQPDALVKSTIQEVMTSLHNDSKIDAEGAVKLVTDKVFPHFDFERITQLAMGKNWNEASADQQQHLVKEFEELLVRSYVNQLLANRNSAVDVKQAIITPDGKDASVITEVTNASSGNKVSIAYSLSDSAAGWKVNNISVDGVSLVTSYRSSFNNAIRQGGIDGLIQKIHDKNAQASGK